ncbi:MAG: anti-sigma factor domain-containing protein [Candidatus Binataceae bacterium]
MDHEAAKNLLARRVLGRLDREAALEVDSHLASGCEECKRELKALHEAAARLSGAANWSDAVQPANSREARAADESERDGSSLGGWLVLGGAAAVVIAAMVFYLYSPLRTAPPPAPDAAVNGLAAIKSEMDTLSQQIDWEGNKLAAIDGKLSANIDLTIAAISPDSRVARIAGSSAAPQSMGIVAVSRAQGTAILEVTGLPPVPASKEYAVWWIGAMQSPFRAGLFAPAIEGATVVSLTPPPANDRLLSTTITLEPQGGTGKPSGPLYAKGDFPHR